MTKKEVYFSIEPTPGVGFTDQMSQFRTFYKLGLASGYIYLHHPFLSPRSSMNILPRRRSGWRRFLTSVKWVYRVAMKKIMGIAITESKPDQDVYGFLGFNEYFHEKHKLQDLKRFQKITVKLGDNVLTDFNISTLEELQKWLAAHIPESVPVTSKVLLKMILSGPREKCFKLINSKISNYPDGLDLRAIYFEKRRKHPWGSAFGDGKVKTLVHIRQGDTATLETPWNTYISLWPKNCAFKEYSRFSDIPTDVVQIEDYHRFIKTLFSYFTEGTFSTLLFSDGFYRTFGRLKRNIRELKRNTHLNNASKNRLLKIDPRRYEEKKFSMFRSIENSNLFLGEDFEKLRHLIHSFMTADLIIAGRQQAMIPSLIADYCDIEHTPTVIILCRTNTIDIWESYEALGLCEKKDKFIFVDMRNPDYEKIAQKLIPLFTVPGQVGLEQESSLRLVCD